jgi:1-deoxy-D-xylulose-5-phosphate reductoisomerase
MQYVTVLGSTGSIGINTLDVIARHRSRFSVFALTAHTQSQKLFEQCLQFNPEYAVLNNEKDADKLQSQLRANNVATIVLAGEKALVDVAVADRVDVVMAAIVGAAGLPPTIAAVKASKKILLANKESLVMAGQLFMNAVKESNALLLPIDSEHNAIHQCLPMNSKSSISKCGVSKILLTASGGPFINFSTEQLREVTPEQACAHPNWSMGKKISVDSASLMNKGLELIEACWLFDTTPQNIEIVIHPQSIIHSMVQYDDGSTLAQMGNPDMRTPIAYGLNWPERLDSGVSALDLFTIARLDFLHPDESRFPCLRLAREAFETGKTAAAVLNAANEIAVEAFLQGKIAFVDIPVINEKVLNKASLDEPVSLDVVLNADQEARRLARELF